MHHHLSRCLAINRAPDHCPCHNRCRQLNALKIRKQVRHCAIRLASFAHFRYRLCQHRSTLPLPAHRHRQLPGMCMANLRARLRRSFTLHAIPSKHLAPPVVGVPRLRYSGKHSVPVPRSLLNHFAFSILCAAFSITAITCDVGDSGDRRALRDPPPLASTMIPKELSHSTPEILRAIDPKPRQTGLKSLSKVLVSSIRPISSKVLLWGQLRAKG